MLEGIEVILDRPIDGVVGRAEEDSVARHEDVSNDGRVLVGEEVVHGEASAAGGSARSDNGHDVLDKIEEVDGGGASLALELVVSLTLLRTGNGHGEGVLLGVVVWSLLSDTASDVSLAVLAVAGLEEDASLVQVDHILGVDVGTSGGIVAVPEQVPTDEVDGEEGLVGRRRSTLAGEAESVLGLGDLGRGEESWPGLATADLGTEEEDVHLGLGGLGEDDTKVGQVEEVQSTKDGGPAVAGTSEGPNVTVGQPPTTPPTEGALGRSTANGTKKSRGSGVDKVEVPDGNGHLTNVLGVGVSTAQGGMRHALQERLERRPIPRTLGRGHDDDDDGTKQ